jgi:hypothetical protein
MLTGQKRLSLQEKEQALHAWEKKIGKLSLN